MKTIDRLIIKARKIYQANIKALRFAFVTEIGERYKAEGFLWDGKLGSSGEEDKITSWHDTEKEAVSAINKLSEEYPYNRDVQVLIIKGASKAGDDNDEDTLEGINAPGST